MIKSIGPMVDFIEVQEIIYIKKVIRMTTLRQILDQTLELLQHPEFKSFGDLQKHKYQMSKPEEDREIRRIMYEGGLGNSEEAKKKASETRKNNPKRKEQEKKAAQTRAAWYKNPENYEKFKEAIRKRDKKKNQSSGNNF